MNGFNVGVLVSLGDMELALDYLNDEKVFEPEITEYQKDRRQTAEKQKISDIGHGTFELNTQSHSSSIRNSSVEDESELHARGVEVEDDTVVHPPEDELNEWDETYSDEYTSSEEADEFESYSDESDEFDDEDCIELSEDEEEYGDEQEDSDEFEDNSIELSEDEEEYSDEQDNSDEQEEYSDEQDNLELERQILEAQRKLKEAKERKDRALAAKKALKEKLERTLMEINKLENESEALETENKHASELLSEVESDNKKKSLAGNGAIHQESVKKSQTDTKQIRNEAVRRGNTRSKQIEGSKKLRNEAPRLSGTQSVRNIETAKPVLKKAHKPNTQPKANAKVNKEEQYNSLDIDTLYTKVVEFMMAHEVSKSAIDRNILDTEFGVLNINKLIMKSYLISMGKKVTIGK